MLRCIEPDRTPGYVYDTQASKLNEKLSLQVGKIDPAFLAALKALDSERQEQVLKCLDASTEAALPRFVGLALICLIFLNRLA